MCVSDCLLCQKSSCAVRKVIHYSLEMEALSVEKAQEKMKMCDKLGDLCCSIKAFPAAIKFYEQQVLIHNVCTCTCVVCFCVVCIYNVYTCKVIQ